MHAQVYNIFLKITNFQVFYIIATVTCANVSNIQKRYVVCIICTLYLFVYISLVDNIFTVHKRRIT